MSNPNVRREQNLNMVGTTLMGKYRVLELLGQGGFGSVFLVEIVAGMVGEKLALKLLPKEVSEDAKAKGQFLNEIRVAMRMVNKYIVQVRDVGETEEGQLYYTMDYCPGETLAALLRRERKLPPARAIPVALRILEALKTAHAAGVIHRDLKPANVMVFPQDGHETARVLDFGIATAIEAGKKTGTGFVGSPHYMPPEQFLNEELGFYTDTYSVGVILYECLTGQKPYSGRTPQEVYNDLKSRPVASPVEVNPDLAAYPGLSAVMTRALERNPDLRYPTAKDLFNELKAVLEGKVQEPAPAVPMPQARSAPAIRSRRRIVKAGKTSMASGIAIAAGIAGVGTLLVVFLMNWKGGEAPAEPPPKSTPVAAAVSPSTPPRKAPEDPEEPTPVVTIVEPAISEVASKGTQTKGAEIKGTDKKAQAAKVNPAAAKREAEERAREILAKALQEAQGERWDKVRELAQDALVLNPQSVAGQRLKGQAELKLGMHEEALTSLQKAKSQLSTQEIDANLVLFILEATKARPNPDPDEIQLLTTEALEALEREPENAAATRQVLVLLDEQSREEDLVALLNRAKTQNVKGPEIDRLQTKYLVELPKEREAKARALLTEAKKALESGNFKQAAGKASEGFKLKPLAELGLTLAQAHYESGKTQEALQALTAAGKHVGEDSESLARLGILYARTYLADFTGTGKKKLDAIDRAHENLEAAIEALKDPKIKAAPLLAAARTYRARCHAFRGDLDKVDEDVKAARAILDKDADLTYHQAESYYFTAERLKDPDRSAALQRANQRLAVLNDMKEAAREPRGWYLMGLCYLQLGGKRDNFNDAIKRFQEAQRFGMKEPKLYEAWAQAYLGLGDQVRAGQKYRESFEAKPTVEACLSSAKCFLEANSKLSAERIVRDGLKIYPNNQELKNLLSQLTR